MFNAINAGKEFTGNFSHPPIPISESDIFSNLESIEVQFHHWIRTLPASTKIYANSRNKSLKNVWVGSMCPSHVVRE